MTMEKLLERLPYFFALDRDLANRLLEILAKGKSALDAVGDAESANEATSVIGAINRVLESSCRLHSYPEEIPNGSRPFFVWAKDKQMRKEGAVIDYWCLDARWDGRWLVSGTEPLYWLELPEPGSVGGPEAAADEDTPDLWFK